ncbi:DNA gyrase subunit A [Priestia filamentosa]|uniref:DNA gyrase subunit A n=1 Tax=Priestia filamentosa TaxID=1402861 RepID=UPI00397BAF68
MLAEEQIKEIPITSALANGWIDYAMSVIISRAIPDVRDGLKPVHRRILHAMNELKNSYDRPYKKSARTVGEVIGKYHPHGDTAVYETMVRMAQGFKMRVPLVSGHGNFGSIDGDSPAAMRYTESRLAKVAHELLRGIEKNTVNFQDNFDGSEVEPIVLPAKLPNLLVNGTEGIAVGMATSMPPHNLKEVCESIIKQLDNPEITVEELSEIIQGPDFPTGGIILGEEGFKKAYATGRGSIILRGVVEREFIDGYEALVIRQIPYQVNKEKLIGQIKQIQRDFQQSKREMNKKNARKVVQKGMDFIQDIHDETEGEDSHANLRVVIQLKNGVNPERVMKYLYKHTQLQQSFGIINLALVPMEHGMEPQVLNLKEINEQYIAHQREVKKREIQFDLTKKENEMYLLEAVIRALGHIDETVRIIKEAKTQEQAVEGLKRLLDLEEKQAKHIMALRLQRLASYEVDEQREKHTILALEIKELQKTLASQTVMDNLIKEDILLMIDEYGEDRITQVGPEAHAISDEELIEKEDVVVTMTQKGMVKRIPQSQYRVQRKNGRGVNGMNTFDDDYVKHLQVANTHDTLMFFTNKGLVYKTKAHQVPLTNTSSKGVSIRTIFDMQDDEYVQAILAIEEFNEEQTIVFGTKQGIVKRTKLVEYNRSARNGILAITLNEGDEVVNVGLTSGDMYTTLITRQGKSITFNESDVKVVSRSGKGVKGIDLSSDDEIVSLSIHKGFSQLFISTSRGIGKRTPLSEFRIQKRGGKGVRAINVNGKTGIVVGTCVVDEDDQLILLTKQGTIIKMWAKEISSFSRNAQGSGVINLKVGDELIAVDRNSEQEQDEEPETN